MPGPCNCSFACIKVYNDWDSLIPGTTRRTVRCTGTMPTTGIEYALAELHRCAEMGLRRAVQLELRVVLGALRGGRSVLAAAVEIGMPVNVHMQFFFPAGDLGSTRRPGRSAAGGTRQEARPGRHRGELPVDPDQLHPGVERVPELVLTRCTPDGRPSPRFDDSVMRKPARVGASAAAWAVAEYFAAMCRSCTSSTRSARRAATTSVSET